MPCSSIRGRTRLIKPTVQSGSSSFWFPEHDQDADVLVAVLIGGVLFHQADRR